MRDKKQWKTAMEYALGIVGLAAAIAVALVLPGLYADWQDARMIGTVHTDSREGIAFIDGDSLNIAGRIKMLGQVAAVELVDQSYEISSAWDQARLAGKVEFCRTKTQEWTDCGLLPENLSEFLTEENLDVAVDTWLITDMGSLPISAYAFSEASVDAADGTASDGKRITLILDSETEMLYYVSVKGNMRDTYILDYLSQCLGYGSFQEAFQCYADGAWPYALTEPLDADTVDCDFASPCGALSSHITGYQEMLSLDVDLEFETFTGKAYRRLCSYDSYDYSYSYSSVGFAVMYGSVLWMELDDAAYNWVNVPVFTATDELLFGERYSDKDLQELAFLYDREDSYLTDFLERYGFSVQDFLEGYGLTEGMGSSAAVGGDREEAWPGNDDGTEKEQGTFPVTETEAMDEKAEQRKTQNRE